MRMTINTILNLCHHNHQFLAGGIDTKKPFSRYCDSLYRNEKVMPLRNSKGIRSYAFFNGHHGNWVQVDAMGVAHQERLTRISNDEQVSYL